MSSTLTAGFIDLATYDELEVHLYGGPDCYTPFVRNFKLSTWFTQVPVALNLRGSADFGSNTASNVTRGGDYLLHNWMRFVTPVVTLSSGNQFGSNGRLRWCRNLGHNIIDEVNISFNEMAEAKFGSFFLDFFSAFTVPAGKRNGYDNMIGNSAFLTNPVSIDPTNGGKVLPSVIINTPLPLPHTRDSGVALPTAAIPYNEMTININLRPWTAVLILDNLSTGASVSPTISDLGGTAPSLSNFRVWANYAIVSNEERKKMGSITRDIIIEQVQTSAPQTWNPTSTSSFDIRFSHAVKALFFVARNCTLTTGATTSSNGGQQGPEWSNYTAGSPVPTAFGVNFAPSNAVDPFSTITLQYESTQRLQEMPIDYFALVAPYYHAVSIPLETGYHVYSYSLAFIEIDPLGSTNFGKLTNVSVIPTASTAAQAAAVGGLGLGSGANAPQFFQFIACVLNHNMFRIFGGSVGFPVL